MAAAASLPSERDLLTRLVAGTAGALGKEFLRRLVAGLPAALNAAGALFAEAFEDRPGIARTVARAGRARSELPQTPAVAFVAELCEDRPEIARTIASAGRPGIELPETSEFALAGTPCEDAYKTDLLLVARGARLRYPADRFLRRHALDGYLAIALH